MVLSFLVDIHGLHVDLCCIFCTQGYMYMYVMYSVFLFIKLYIGSNYATILLAYMYMYIPLNVTPVFNMMSTALFNPPLTRKSAFSFHTLC